MNVTPVASSGHIPEYTPPSISKIRDIALFIFNRIYRYFFPEKISLNPANFSIIITGEKGDYRVIAALEKYTNQNATYVPLKELNSYSKENHILLLIFHKQPGNSPIRGFSELDGPLKQYRDMLQFKHKAALIITVPSEENSTDRQLQLQLTEFDSKKVMKTHAFWNHWHIANQVKSLFP